MPARELLQLIACAGRFGSDRLVLEIAPDIRGQIRRRSVAAVLIFFQRFGDNGLDVAAVRAVHHAELRRIDLLDGAHRLMQHARQLVGHLAGEQLIEDDAQRVDIAAGIEGQGIGQNLLRAHVGERAQQLAEVGLARGLGIHVGDPRYAEVQDLRLAALIDENVARL
jgi:hypothetical protein